MEKKNLNGINTNEINKKSWNAYQETYIKAALADPDRKYFDDFSNGHVGLSCYEPMLSLIGDVKGLKLLDTCCSSDAWQAYSWHNLGAKVTACDITPKAIEIARKNAEKMGLDIEFVVADMQTLVPIPDGQFDIVFASYPVWVQDIFEACRTWNRVLKKGGRLFWYCADHPITRCVFEDIAGVRIIKNYNNPTPDWYDTFDGTGAADRIGGFSADLPSVENFWRISDLLNAVCDAGFCIKKVHEGYEPNEKLPSDFSVLAVKQ